MTDWTFLLTGFLLLHMNASLWNRGWVKYVLRVGIEFHALHGSELADTCAHAVKEVDVHLVVVIVAAVCFNVLFMAVVDPDQKVVLV